MDKLLDTPWAIKVVALALALLLFLSVPKGTPNQPQDVNVPSDQNIETILDVPVKTYYDVDNLVVRGVPDTVDVKVKGPRNIVQQAKTLKNFEVYVDLTKAEIGTQRVPIKIRDLSERLTVTIDPSYANVSIQERVTKEFKVEAEFNQDLIADGYILDKVTVNPDKVKITGAKDVIDRITYVKATLNLKEPISETITREATITVLDRELNKLEVIVDEETVEVTIPVKASSKKVPIIIERKGTPPTGVTIDSITIDTNEATIIANPEVLEKVDNVRVELDVSKITENTEVTLPINISNGIVQVTPEVATITIITTQQGEKTISNIPIKIEGVSEQYDVSFINPENGAVNLTVSGPSDEIPSITASDFNILIDVSTLIEGEHNVNIRVSGPNNITWNLERDTARILVVRTGA